MKKTIAIVMILMIFSIFTFSGQTYAAVLDTIELSLDKENVNPGENVTLTINFGEELGAYTFNIAYDNAIFEYVSVDGGTANDTSDKVKVVYFDSTGIQNPRTNMSITFKAKEDITSSNPTEFTVTAEGMSNNDTTVTFDDITTPIIKNVIVEPEYQDYSLNLDYTGELIVEKENDMKISYSSPAGHYFDKARLVAEAITPEGATVKLIGIDSEGLKHDIIESGWGDAQGYKIGGTNFSQVLNVKGIFSKIGEYTIKLKLIDRGDSDAIIAEKSFKVNVTELKVEGNTNLTNIVGTVNSVTEATNQNVNNTTATTPTTLPKTGVNIYIPLAMIIVSLMGAFIYYNRTK